ncbi:MAG: shikimate kinase [Candidatus Nanopelagicales bacterium]
MAPRVVLVGVPGSGKTTVGRILAERLGVGFRDTDQDVEESQGRSVPDIFVEDGEPYFRALERAAVARALEEHDGVLALGGGAVLDEGTRGLLLEQPTVWLQVGASAGAHRVGLDVPRPVLLGNVRSRMVALLNERAPLYDAVARLKVDTESRSPEEVADVVVAELGLGAHDG